MVPVTWRDLARQIAELDSAAIAPETVIAAKYVFLDWLGCAIAGAQDEVNPRRDLDLAELAGDRPEATLIGSNRRTALCYAALANGIVGRTLCLFDTIGTAGMVVSAAVVPASLSLSEKHGRSGLHFLTAIVAGYEVATYLERNRSKPTCATCSNGQIESCAAAAASARILELNADATANALAMAWSQPVAPPALNGVLSACAAVGKAADHWAVPYGADATCNNVVEVPANACLAWSALRSRNVRLHAADIDTHAAIDAALELKVAYRLHPEDIEAIEVYVSSQAIADTASGDPGTVQSLRQNIPYCLALVFLRGRLGPGELSLQNLLKAPVGWLMSNTTVHSDKRFSDGLSGPRGARVVVRTRYGSTCERTVLNPRGSFGNPVSPREIEAKFECLTTPVLSAEISSMLSRRVLALDDLTNINGLFVGVPEST